MKIGVTSCPRFSLNTTGKLHQPRPRRLTLIERPLCLTVTAPSGSRGIIRQDLELVSCAPTKDPTTRRLRITLTRATECFAISHKFLIKIICRTVLRNALESTLTRSPSRMDWDNLWEVGLKLWNSGISQKKGRKSWRLSRSKARFFLALLRSQDLSMNSRISRRSGQKLPRSAAAIAATLPVAIRTPITHYPEIANDIHIDGLLDARRRRNWIT